MEEDKEGKFAYYLDTDDRQIFLSKNLVQTKST